MRTDLLIEEYRDATDARKAKIILELANGALDIEQAGGRARYLAVHAFIAAQEAPGRNAKSTGHHDIDLASLLGKRPAQGVNPMELMMVDTFINMSREICEESGVTCPPSMANAHAAERAARPAEERIPAHIRELVLRLGFSDEEADDLRPFSHPDNDWYVIINTADHGNDDPDLYATLLAYVRERGIFSAGDLHSLPSDRAEFIGRKARNREHEARLQEFLERNTHRAEQALRALIDRAISIGATRIVLTDHPGYGFALGVSEHDGTGEMPSEVVLVDGYHAWLESLATAEDQDPSLDTMDWDWIRERWLACGGADCEVEVSLFNNGIGDTMDLTSGERSS